MATKKNYEIVKEPTSGKGRPREYKINTRTHEEDKGKITYKFEKKQNILAYMESMYMLTVKEIVMINQ